MDSQTSLITAVCFIGGLLAARGFTGLKRRRLQTLEAKVRQGDAASMVALGRKYYEGKGVPQNKETAFAYFKQAAKAGLPPPCAVGETAARRTTGKPSTGTRPRPSKAIMKGKSI